MTAAEAQALHRQIVAAGGWAMWMVSLTVAECPNQAVAWAVVIDYGGGTRQRGELVADTLEQLRAMMPPGITRRDPTPYLPQGVVETWE